MTLGDRLFNYFHAIPCTNHPVTDYFGRVCTFEQNIIYHVDILALYYRCPTRGRVTFKGAIRPLWTPKR